MLVIPLVIGLVGGPVSTRPAQGDELRDARARQAALKKEMAEQKAAVAKLESMQRGLADEIRATKNQLRGINADLVAVKKKIKKMEARIDGVKAKYAELVAELQSLGLELVAIEAKEVAKKAELKGRLDQLAERVRSAYDSDRTSMLESFLSGGTFTDMLTEMSYHIDVGEQDEALARQIVRDQEALAELHGEVVATRDRTNVLRQETAAQKRALDRSLKALKVVKAELKKLEKETARALANQKATYGELLRNKKQAKQALARAAAAQNKLAAKIREMVRKQMQAGRIPSKFNGTLIWPMAGRVTQDFGCTGFAWEPPLGSCAHFHRGIDVVAPYGTGVKASAAGTVVYIGWNYADGYDPAWIVIVAHSQGLQTWYAHLQPRYPNGISAGSQVKKGQIIGYEGNTGHSTGAHLHWMVMSGGNFVNPRLFL